MNHEDNIEYDNQQEKELFSQLEVNYSKSKDQVWNELDKMISEEDDSKSGNIIVMKWVRMSIAASIALLIGAGLFTKFYTISHSTNPGIFASYMLPDGSEVHLNAESSITYAPYWWRFNRRVELAGEAFFEVEKGKLFSVVSKQGSTEVLGTSFNIYARYNEYQVFCVTGKVRVSDKKTNQIILTPGEFGSNSLEAVIQEMSDFSEDAVLSWRLNKFIYNTTPLTRVFDDMERQFNIDIDLGISIIDDYRYTGLFERSVTAEEAMAIICYSFGLDFEKQGPNSFKIKEDAGQN